MPALLAAYVPVILDFGRGVAMDLITAEVRNAKKKIIQSCIAQALITVMLAGLFISIQINKALESTILSSSNIAPAFAFSMPGAGAACDTGMTMLASSSSAAAWRFMIELIGLLLVRTARSGTRG